MQRFFAFTFVAWLGFGSAVWSQSAPPTGVIPLKGIDKAVPVASLDQLIADALKHNPDIRVAESKVREAEAELSRTRMKVVSDVTFLQAEIQAAQALANHLKSQYELVNALYNDKKISREEYFPVVLAFEKASADLALKQAKLPYLLGKQAGASVRASAVDALILGEWISKKHETATTDGEFLRRVMMDVLGRVPTADEMKDFLKMPEKDRREKWLDQLSRKERVAIERIEGLHTLDVSRIEAVWALVNLKAPDSPLTNKLRKALDTPISLKAGDIDQAALMEYVREKLKGVNLHVRAKSAKKAEIHVFLGEPIPLGAFLQFIEDESGCVFVLRDYGIVVTAADSPLPPGAVRVIDFWKRGGKTETKQDAKEKK